MDSFDFYVEKDLPRLLRKLSVSASTYEFEGERRIDLKFSNSKLRKMLMLESDGLVHKVYPSECRARKLTYSLAWYCDVSVRRSKGAFSTLRDCYLGRIPCMLGSKLCHLHDLNEAGLQEKGECPYDPKGYFIVSFFSARTPF